MPLTIDPLEAVPDLAGVIAERCWRQWWTDSDVSLAAYRAGVDAMTIGPGVPFALAAHQDGTYVGSTFVIENDLASRPRYAPWIAALWVEQSYRGQGVARQLIAAASAAAAAHGHSLCYLCATAETAPYYEARGFRRIDTDEDGMAIFAIDAQAGG